MAEKSFIMDHLLPCMSMLNLHKQNIYIKLNRNKVIAALQ